MEGKPTINNADRYSIPTSPEPVLCPGQRPSYWYSYARNLPGPTKKTVDLYSIPTRAERLLYRYPGQQSGYRYSLKDPSNG